MPSVEHLVSLFLVGGWTCLSITGSNSLTLTKITLNTGTMSCILSLLLSRLWYRLHCYVLLSFDLFWTTKSKGRIWDLFPGWWELLTLMGKLGFQVYVSIFCPLKELLLLEVFHHCRSLSLPSIPADNERVSGNHTLAALLCCQTWFGGGGIGLFLGS